jgi:hypothetical protein
MLLPQDMIDLIITRIQRAIDMPVKGIVGNFDLAFDQPLQTFLRLTETRKCSINAKDHITA